MQQQGPEGGIPCRHAVSILTSSVQEQDGFLVAGQDLPLFFVEDALPADRLLVLHHDREGLGWTVLPGTEFLHCLFVGRVAAQMKTADSLNCHDAAFQDGSAGGRDGFPSDDLRLHPASGLSGRARGFE